MSHFGIGSVWFRLESASFTDGMSNSSHAVRDLGRVRQYPPWLLFAAFVESVGCPRYNRQKTRKQ